MNTGNFCYGIQNFQSLRYFFLIPITDFSIRHNRFVQTAVQSKSRVHLHFLYPWLSDPYVHLCRVQTKYQYKVALLKNWGMKLARYGIIPYLCNEDSVANDYRFLARRRGSILRPLWLYIYGELKPKSLYYFSFKKCVLMAESDVTLTLGGGDI